MLKCLFRLMESFNILPAKYGANVLGVEIKRIPYDIVLTQKKMKKPACRPILLRGLRWADKKYSLKSSNVEQRLSYIIGRTI